MIVGPPSAAPDRDRPYAEHDLDRECFWLHLTEEQATVLAGGFVPNSVKSVLRELLDYAAEDQRRAERPVPPKKRRESGYSVRRRADHSRAPS